MSTTLLLTPLASLCKVLLEPGTYSEMPEVVEITGSEWSGWALCCLHSELTGLWTHHVQMPYVHGTQGKISQEVVLKSLRGEWVCRGVWQPVAAFHHCDFGAKQGLFPLPQLSPSLPWARRRGLDSHHVLPQHGGRGPGSRDL
ncbi:hypothetical protein HJG60_008544 [Phyllostomus discolor]|uniref:Uncharacterized protein n=1 Tax=Phyllostomus discolor TaxID=89673 RepID=A0A834DI31_9CHIR|nr:hypothetical protein HJG60_008544 [Phyllostomus discolor]